ncbi:MAG TPA: SDR family oxidoreductase, partial [Thermoanaerobaculia bacterium]|nr:SDR family oxidoreductase [Thermoanaerobaculia bacterium]
MEPSIFITGAASGIGRETALLFAERGWRVGLFDVNREGLESLAGQIGERALAGALDVRDLAQYRLRVAELGQWTGGRLDALFNCAGIMRMGPFAEVPIEQQVLTVEVNVIGVLNGIHAALGLLKATPGAHILTMGSASGIYGVPDLATYSATKFFIRGLTEGLSLELERDGIVVTDLMPLYVDTPMVR